VSIFRDCLRRATNNWQSNSVGDTTEKKLTPTKLASFYKAVGGNYDCKVSFLTRKQWKQD
jgi:hypothetical protein